MANFRGTYSCSVDSKGRINIPAKFRKALSPEANETFAICLGPDGCLRAYPIDKWEKFEDELYSRAETPETLKYIRILRHTLSDSKLDSQGRIMLTADQMKVAGIKKSATVIGHRDFLEIWDSEKYDSIMNDISIDEYNDLFYKSVGAVIKDA